MKDGQTQHRSKVRVRVNPNLRHRSPVPEKRPGRQPEEETDNSYNDGERRRKDRQARRTHMVHRRRGEEGIGRERREEMVSELRSRWTSGDEVTGAGPASSRRAAASSRRRIESERDETTATASGGSGVGLGLGMGGQGAAFIRPRPRGGGGQAALWAGRLGR